MNAPGPTLADLSPGTVGRIHRVNEASVVGERLMEMGLVPGTLVQVVEAGRMGQPMQLLLRGYRLRIRRSDARRIELSS